MLRKAMVALPMLCLAASGIAAVAAPQRPVAERSLAEVRILPHAHLVDGGATITVRVRMRCEPNGTDGIQWEGYIWARQGDVFAWAGLPLVCDGRQHVEAVKLPVSAPPETMWFTRGLATVNVSVVDENNMLTEYAADMRTVTVRGAG